MKTTRVPMRTTMNFLAGLLLLMVLAPRANAQGLMLYNDKGVYVGSVIQPSAKAGPHLMNAPAGMTVSIDGRTRPIPAGFYFALPSTGEHGAAGTSTSGSFGFADITSETLPPGDWASRDLLVADFNGDSLQDLLVVQYSLYCDSIAGVRPRLLLQTQAGLYVDETEGRIPDSTYPSNGGEVLDADGDGDQDIFLEGSGCLETSAPPATLLINDGSGVFTDQSSIRLPGATNVDASAVGLIDSNDSPDLVIIELYPDSINNHIHPEIWLNDGAGAFRRDTAGRLLRSDYGYLRPTTADLNGDGNDDVIFSNLPFCVTTPDSPGCVAEFKGGTAVYLNQGNGFLLDETATRMPPLDSLSFRGAEPADVDNDGDLDLLLLHLGLFEPPPVSLLRNDGTGHFQASPSPAIDTLTDIVLDAAAGKVNGDDYTDFIFARVILGGVPAQDVLLINDGGTGWADSSSLLPDSVDFSTSVELFDHDRDGDSDIVFGNYVGARLYRNLLNEATGIGDPPAGVPLAAKLMPNYPNPFNPGTVIEYTIPNRSRVTLAVYNVLGERVAVLVDGVVEPGLHSVRWNAEGRPSGLYYCRFQAGEYSESKAMVLLK